MCPSPRLDVGPHPVGLPTVFRATKKPHTWKAGGTRRRTRSGALGARRQGASKDCLACDPVPAPTPNLKNALSPTGVPFGGCAPQPPIATLDVWPSQTETCSMPSAGCPSSTRWSWRSLSASRTRPYTAPWPTCWPKASSGASTTAPSTCRPARGAT